MSTLAEQFGPSLLIATIAAPLLVLAVFVAPQLRALARILTPLAALPALAAGALASSGATFGAELPALRVSLSLDWPGGFLLLAAALVWLLVSFARAPVAAIVGRSSAVNSPSKEGRSSERPLARGYKGNPDRFEIAWLLTMAGSLGVFIAADLLTFYFVYALVSVPAYYLIAHDDEAGSLRAGGVNLAFALLGEAVLLIAFVMLAAGEPSGSVQIHDVVAALPGSPWRDAALALIILGFGMKIAIFPLHGWMPLTYEAAPIPAAAVLSGAGVKAGVIGLIRFLPLGAAFPGWGEALVWAGFITAFYGVAVGLTQRDPKPMLAYSSISQMGVIAAAFGMALMGAQQGAATEIAFYAANHVLVKAALFLTIGAVAALEGRARTYALVAAALLGLSLAGLPLTGGSLAKLALKDLFGSGAAGVASQASAAATTALMLVFVLRLVHSPRQVAAFQGRLAPWALLAVVGVLLPWLLYMAIGTPADALGADKLIDALWPMAIGAAVAAAVWAGRDRLPRIPAGDIVVAEEAAFRASLSLGAAFDRVDRAAREWAAAGLALLAIALALTAAGWAGR
jgi:formate hydrogenlyase subunit 3/multisubunit Na+/H+ antiporter MnhD subunit